MRKRDFVTSPKAFIIGLTVLSVFCLCGYKDAYASERTVTDTGAETRQESIEEENETALEDDERYQEMLEAGRRASEEASGFAESPPSPLARIPVKYYTYACAGICAVTAVIMLLQKKKEDSNRDNES